MKIKVEDIDKIIGILQNAKKELKEAQVFEFSNNKLKIIDTFVLPEKWYLDKCKSSAEYKYILKFIEKSKTSHASTWQSVKFNSYCLHGTGLKYDNGFCEGQKGYKLISLEEFKKYVLNKE